MKFVPILALALCSLGATSAAAQSGGQSSAAGAKNAQKNAAKDSATISFKDGNTAAGVAQLRAGVVRTAKARSEDVQVVSDVCAIARELAVVQHPNTRATAQAAVAEANRAKGALTRVDAALLDTQIGELHEFVLGDAAQAAICYQSALAQDSARTEAKAGLQRIARLRALLESRQSENVALRARSK